MRSAVLFLLFAAAGFSQTLPSAARSALDAKYPGWKPGDIAESVQDWFDSAKFAYKPNLLEGDFDGNGRPDYAARIVSNGHEYIVVLLDRGGKFEAMQLTQDDPDRYTFLALYKKGDKDFDFEQNKAIIYAHDSIGVFYFEKTILAFTWDGNGFHRREDITEEELEARTKNAK